MKTKRSTETRQQSTELAKAQKIAKKRVKKNKIIKAKQNGSFPEATSSGKKQACNLARLPKSKEDASSNWKALLKEMDSQPTTKKQKRPYRVIKGSAPLPAEAAATNGVEKKVDIWFDDVDEMLLDPEDRKEFRAQNATTTTSTTSATSDSNGQISTGEKSDGLVKEKSFKGVTRLIAMDCEMVGVGFRGEDSIVARVSLVNHFGNCIYDKFVKPTETVTDYRTAVSGVRPKDLVEGESFKVVQKEVSDLLRGRVLVGHALKHDLKVLFLDHPRKMTRDTATFKQFRKAFGGKTPSLKNLAARMLGVTVQTGEHSSVQDAQAAMRLYTMFRKEWESAIDERRNKGKTKRL